MIFDPHRLKLSGVGIARRDRHDPKALPLQRDDDVAAEIDQVPGAVGGKHDCFVCSFFILPHVASIRQSQKMRNARPVGS